MGTKHWISYFKICQIDFYEMIYLDMNVKEQNQRNQMSYNNNNNKNSLKVSHIWNKN